MFYSYFQDFTNFYDAFIRKSLEHILCLLIFNAFMITDFSYVCIIFELP